MRLLSNSNCSHKYWIIYTCHCVQCLVRTINAEYNTHTHSKLCWRRYSSYLTNKKWMVNKQAAKALEKCENNNRRDVKVECRMEWEKSKSRSDECIYSKHFTPSYSVYTCQTRYNVRKLFYNYINAYTYTYIRIFNSDTETKTTTMTAM